MQLPLFEVRRRKRLPLYRSACWLVVNNHGETFAIDPFFCYRLEKYLRTTPLHHFFFFEDTLPDGSIKALFCRFSYPMLMFPVALRIGFFEDVTLREDVECFDALLIKQSILAALNKLEHSEHRPTMQQWVMHLHAHLKAMGVEGASPSEEIG
ncbi:MAG: hypothetical protein RML72_08810 [Bacteroidia bacterium]|nr:hypothetical protein [Bacteroidia bacterium]